jgi:hypothetical protein
MNERIKQLMDQAVTFRLDPDSNAHEAQVHPEDLELFAELLIDEICKLNKQQSYELQGVIIDTEEGDGFDQVCLNTVKRVHEYLAADTLKKHFEINHD